LPTDCLNIQRSIDIVSNDAQTLLKRKSDLEQREKLDETNLVLGELKRLQISQDCETKLATLKREQERQTTLSDLSALTEGSVGKAQQELLGLKQSVSGGAAGGGLTNQKLLIYGGVGVGALVLLAVILKRRAK
jgi:hypothetical protein